MEAESQPQSQTSIRRLRAASRAARRVAASAAAQPEAGSHAIEEAPAADGGTTKVLLDWNGSRLLFWAGMPGDPPERTLMALAAAEAGLVGVAVDAELRPQDSGRALDELLGGS